MILSRWGEEVRHVGLCCKPPDDRQARVESQRIAAGDQRSRRAACPGDECQVRILDARAAHGSLDRHPRSAASAAPEQAATKALATSTENHMDRPHHDESAAPASAAAAPSGWWRDDG